MFFAGQDKNVMSNRSLSQAIAMYKTAANLARTLGIDPELIYKWHNEDIRIPLPMALRIEDVTNIDFERLSPHVNGGLKADENDRSSKGIKANSLTAFS